MDFDDAQYSIVEVLALASWSPNLEVPGATKVPTYLFHPSSLQVRSSNQRSACVYWALYSGCSVVAYI